MRATEDGQKVEVDPASMLKVWAETADVFKQALDGMDANSSEMQVVRKEMESVLRDNAVTRKVSRNTRWIVLGSCAVTVALSLWTTREVRVTARDARQQVADLVAHQTAMVKENTAEARKEAAETRRIALQVGKKADDLAQLQAAISGAQMAEEEAKQARGSQALEKRIEAEQRRAKAKAKVEALDGL